MSSSLAPTITLRERQHTSYLYDGFRAVVYLPSIRRQRELQSLLLQPLAIDAVLFAGCGYGDEMATLLRKGLPAARHVVAIDIADVDEDVAEVADRIERPISFYDCDLLDLEDLPDSGSFELIQAGFVFHDLADDEKDEGFAVAAHTLRFGGYLLLSDFFPPPISPEALYGEFIKEAERETRAGRMPRAARDEFLGDGVKPGLLRTIARAAAGERDFFDTPDMSVNRARRHGLRLVATRINDINASMRTLLFQKTPSASAGGRDVFITI